MANNRVGPPVRGADCYGREAFVALVWDKLDGGHVLLAAPRRFGKTSVMYRLIDAPRKDYKIVHVDLESLTEPSELITEMIVRLASDSRLSKIAQGMTALPKAVWEGIRNNVGELELYQFKVKLKERVRANWQESGEELFKKLNESKQPILFILDEFPMMIDRMARTKEKREEAIILLRWLRALRQAPHAGNVRFLIAGSIGIDYVLNELGEISAINDFERLRLELFSPKVAAAFLDELSATHNLALSTEPTQNA